MRKILTILLTLLMLFGDVSIAAETEYTQKTASAFNLVGMDYARSLGYEGQGQTIVVLDDGVQLDHPNLSSALVDGYCASVEVCGSDLGKSGIQYGKALADTDFHGSMVSGVAAGRATSVALGGVAPKANLISINIKNGNNDAIVRAINWVLTIKDKYKIASVNLSAGSLMPRPRGASNPCEFFGSGDQEISDGITALYNAGIPFIIAAGNSSQFNQVDFPACISKAITVGSVVSFVAPDNLRFGNQVGDIANYSNIGPEIDVLAPSEGVAAATNNGNYMIGSGTSSAAPFIAGVIALLKQAKPTATVEEIGLALATTVSYKSDIYYSNLPLVHLPSAINALVTSKFSDKKVKPLTTAEAKYLSDKALADAKTSSDKALADAKTSSDKALADARALSDELSKTLTEARASWVASQKELSDLIATSNQFQADFNKAYKSLEDDLFDLKMNSDKALAKAISDTNAAHEKALADAKTSSDKALADARALSDELSKTLADVQSSRNASQKDLAEVRASVDVLLKNLADARDAKTSSDKALADAKTSSDKALADAKTASDKAIAEAKSVTKVLISITCVKGKLSKTVVAAKPLCPTGYKKK